MIQLVPRKPRALKAAAAASPLLEPLRFIGSVLKETGSVNETHCLLSNGWAVAFNGIVAAGIKIASEIYAAPNYALLVAAFAKCGQDVSITNNPLTIKSGKFKAIIPCVDPILINIANIDTPSIPITNDFKKALEIVGVLANENAQTIHGASVLINGPSVVSTEGGRMIIEFWHGLPLPTNLAVPKAFINSLSKISKNLKAFGHSASTITIYFEDDSFIRTQLYGETWPDIGKGLDKKSNPLPIPKTLYEGLNAIEPFTKDNLVHFNNNILYSSADIGDGASYEVEGLPGGLVFNIKQLQIIKDLIKTVDFFVDGGKVTLWFGDKVRGAIAGRSKE